MKLIKKPTHTKKKQIDTPTPWYISMLISNKYSQRIPATFPWKYKHMRRIHIGKCLEDTQLLYIAEVSRRQNMRDSGYYICSMHLGINRCALLETQHKQKKMQLYTSGYCIYLSTYYTNRMSIFKNMFKYFSLLPKQSQFLHAIAPVCSAMLSAALPAEGRACRDGMLTKSGHCNTANRSNSGNSSNLPCCTFYSTLKADFESVIYIEYRTILRNPSTFQLILLWF